MEAPERESFISIVFLLLDQVCYPINNDVCADGVGHSLIALEGRV